MPNTSFLQPEGVSDNTTTHTVLPVDLHTLADNSSMKDGCVEKTIRKMEYLPWDNSHNLVSAEVESIIHIAKNVLLVFIFLIGGPGNVINMAVFYRQGLKDRVNLCLFSLALADELYLSTKIVYRSEQLFLQLTQKKGPGPVNMFLTNNHFVGLMGFGYISYVLSAIIASERCHCVLSPLSYQNLMRTRTMGAIIAAVYVVMTGLYFIAVGFQHSYGCKYDPMTGAVEIASIPGTFYETHRQFIDILHSSIFGVILPLLVIVVVTVTTIVTAVKLRQAVTWRAKSSFTISPREVALTKMLMAISFLFIICIIPSAFAHNVSTMFPEMNIGRRNHNLFLIVVWLSQMFTYVNASANIFVYYAMGSRYRQTFWSLFGRKTRREQNTTLSKLT